MIEVFKTNIFKKESAKDLIHKLSECFPEYKINFDLEDCDNILRIEGIQVQAGGVKEIVNNEGYICELLD